ncbi:MAG TPA: hypothetical protein VH596_03695 [Terriglobales bacterium]|jgi:hypothetical protein
MLVRPVYCLAPAETGGTRTPRKTQTPPEQHNTEPETEAHEGQVHTRTSKRAIAGNYVAFGRGRMFPTA